MSYSRDRNKKEKRNKRSEEEKSVAKKIRAGVYPKFILAKEKGSADKLETRKGRLGRPKLTWRQQSTFSVLTRKE